MSGVHYHRQRQAMTSDLLLNESSCDVTLKVRHGGYSWRIPAHSLLLEAKSAAFWSMLEERAEDDHPTPLAIAGASPESVLAVLKYIYKGEYPTDVTADLLIAAEKFELPALRSRLEETVLAELTVPLACRLFEDLSQRQPASADCPVKSACQDVLEAHALTVFGSDLLLTFSKRTLTELLESDYLNFPDEAFAFWGVWRWGRRESSKLDKSLADNCVAAEIDELIVLIRYCSIKDMRNIPALVLSRFDRCRGRRNMYRCPPDILRHSTTFRLTPAWDDLLSDKTVDDVSVLCCQMSFEKDVMMVGMFLEAYPKEQNLKLKVDNTARLIRERDSVELRRQRACWGRTRLRRTTPGAVPEFRIEAELTFIEPVFLSAGQIYSVYLHGNLTIMSLFWASLLKAKRRTKVGDTFVNLHGDAVTGVREVYLVPDASVTWGPRGPDA